MALIILVAFLLRGPFLKYFKATLPAQTIRSQLPELRREAERVRTESEGRLAHETERLDQEAVRLKGHLEECRSALAD